MAVIHVTMRSTRGWELQFLLECAPGTILHDTVTFEIFEEGCRPVRGSLYAVVVRSDATGSMTMVTQEPDVQTIYAALQSMSKVRDLVMVPR